MVINNVSVQYNVNSSNNVGEKPTVPMFLPLGNPFKGHEDVLSSQPLIPPN